VKDIYLLAMIVLDVLWLVLALYGLSDAIIAVDHSHIHVTVGRVESGLVLVVHRHQSLSLVHWQINRLRLENADIGARRGLPIVRRGHSDLPTGAVGQPLTVVGSVEEVLGEQRL
jgi:hypothetical protein